MGAAPSVTPLILSVTLLNSRISAAGLSPLGLASRSVIAPAKKLEKGKNYEVGAFPSLPTTVCSAFPALFPAPSPAFCQHKRAAVLSVGSWLTDYMATLAEQLGGWGCWNALGGEGIPSPHSPPGCRRQGVQEASGHWTLPDVSQHFPHLPAALEKPS